MNDLERAKYLLRVAARFIIQHAPDRMSMYDDAMCDGYCLAADCTTAADALEAISITELSRAST